ncbi:MAG: hypothetical protein V4456_15090 [Bacteroidota bacterium]
MIDNKSFILNSEGVSLWKSGLPIINILENAGGKPGEKLYHAEWRIMKSLFMQVINPFGEATISFSFKDSQGAELYTGSFRSYKKRARKLVNVQTTEEYDITFQSKWLQNVSCELLKNNKQFFIWKNDNRGGGTVYQSDKPVAYIKSKVGGIGNYKQVDVINEVDTTLLLAFIAVVYSY